MKVVLPTQNDHGTLRKLKSFETLLSGLCSSWDCRTTWLFLLVWNTIVSNTHTHKWCFNHYSLLLSLPKAFFSATSLPHNDTTRLGRWSTLRCQWARLYNSGACENTQQPGSLPRTENKKQGKVRTEIFIFFFKPSFFNGFLMSIS